MPSGACLAAILLAFFFALRFSSFLLLLASAFVSPVFFLRTLERSLFFIFCCRPEVIGLLLKSFAVSSAFAVPLPLSLRFGSKKDSKCPHGRCEVRGAGLLPQWPIGPTWKLDVIIEDHANNAKMHAWNLIFISETKQMMISCHKLSSSLDPRSWCCIQGARKIYRVNVMPSPLSDPRSYRHSEEFFPIVISLDPRRVHRRVYQCNDR